MTYLGKEAGHIKIFGGGGGVILPSEIAELQAYGIRVFTHLMMGDLWDCKEWLGLGTTDFPTGDKLTDEVAQLAENPAIAELSAAENFTDIAKPALEAIQKWTKTVKLQF
jgi:methylmalonyl-CoA mutase